MCLPKIEILKEIVKRAKYWKLKAAAVLKSVQHPSEDQLRALLVKANSMPVKLELVDKVCLFVRPSVFVRMSLSVCLYVMAFASLLFW